MRLAKEPTDLLTYTEKNKKMDRISDSTKCMASLAVFKSLYNEHKDLYEVIANFAKQIIVENNLANFELQQICSLFKSKYGFDLPSAVIKTSLKRLSEYLKINKSYYNLTVGIDDINVKEVDELENKSRKANSKIFESLKSYIGNKKNIKLSQEDLSELNREFCAFVIDDRTEGKFVDLISSFVILHSKDDSFNEQINQIRLGMIIFVGLSYNVDYDSIDGIDGKLNIYLDTEILFHKAGFNGMLYQTLFNEFFDLVKQINSSDKKVISLFYFEETKEEILEYFKVAEDIKNKKNILDPSKQAMKYILDNSEDLSDIKELQAKFFKDLEYNGILLDKQRSYYDVDKYKLNLEESKLLENYEEFGKVDDIYKKLKLLNYINIKRGGKCPKFFRNTGHILLTGSGLVFKIANDKEIREPYSIPLATSLDFITNRLWIISNRGLQKEMRLTTFSLITKAQIVLSTSARNSISKKFNQFLSESKKDNFDLEEKKAILASLHKIPLLPECIQETTQDSYLDFIDNTDINKYLAEQEINKRKINEALRLKDIELSEERRKVKQKNENIKKLLAEKNNRAIADYRELLHEYKIQRRKTIRYKMLKVFMLRLFVLIAYLLIVVALIYLSIRKSKSFILGFVIVSIPFIRPFVPHTYVKNALLYIIKKSNRKVKCMKLLSKYHRLHPIPKLQIQKMEYEND